MFTAHFVPARPVRRSRPLCLERLEDRTAPASVRAAALEPSPLTATSADMAVSMSGPAAAVLGTTVTYTVTLANNGPDSASGVVVTDSLTSTGVHGQPAGVSPSSSNPDSFVVAPPIITGESFTLTANNPIAPGNVDTFL